MEHLQFIFVLAVMLAKEHIFLLFSTGLVWKVARYTSAAPIFFEELDNYVDGGVLANNPASAGLTFIQEMYSKKKIKIPISILVSLGSGIMPKDELDREDSKDFVLFGHIKKMYDKASDLVALLGNAVSLCDLRVIVNTGPFRSLL